MATDQITLLIKAEVDKAVKGLAKVDKSLDGLNKNAKKTKKSSDLLSSGFAKMTVAVGGMAAVYKAAIKPAMDLEESQSRFGTLFRENIDAAEDWADTLVDSYAMSRNEALDALSAFQSMLKPMDMTAENAGLMSNNFAKLAADLGSFNNVPTADVVRDLRSALSGSTETVEKYGANIKIAELQQFALAEGIIKTKGELRGAAKAQAVLAKIVRDTADAQGDMIRTSDSTANVLKKVQARTKDAAAAIGQEIVPGFRDLLMAINKLSEKESSFIGFLKSIGKLLSGIGSTAASAVHGFTALATIVDISIGDMKQSVGEAKIKESLDSMADSLSNAGTSFKEAFAGEDPVEEFLENADGTLEKVESNVIASGNRITEAKTSASAAQLKAQKDALNNFNDFVQSDHEKKKATLMARQEELMEMTQLDNEMKMEVEAEFQEQMSMLKIEKAQQTMQRIQEMTSMATSTLKQGFDLDQKLKEKKLDKEYKKKKARILATVKDEDEQKKQLAALDAEFEKKKHKLKRDAAKKAKGIAIAEAVINTAAAVVSMLKAGFPVGIVMAALAAAMGAAQIGIIAAQPLAEGGVIPGSTAGTLIQAGENAASEAILPLENEAAQEKIGEALGGSAGGQNIINLNIENLYATEDVPEQMAIAIDQALLDLKQGGGSAFSESIVEEQI